MPCSVPAPSPATATREHRNASAVEEPALLLLRPLTQSLSSLQIKDDEACLAERAVPWSKQETVGKSSELRCECLTKLNVKTKDVYEKCLKVIHMRSQTCCFDNTAFL